MLKVLSLFSGIGAFEKALEIINVDFEVVGFSEIDKYAVEVYKSIHNTGEEKSLGDVSKIKNQDLPDADIVTYGFPCQDISIAGDRKGIQEGTRSGLLYEAERIIQEVKPKYAISENVKNLVSKPFKDDFNSLLDRLDSYGYNNYWQVLNASDYGIPQNRERVFIVSIRKDIDTYNFKFPEKMELDIKLKDLLLDNVDDKYYMINDKVYNLLYQLEEQDLLKGDTFCCDSSINKPKRREVSNCLTARYDAGIQNHSQVGLVVAVKVKTNTKKGYDVATVESDYRIRKLTPLECFRLMGFDDIDYFKGKKALEETFYKGKDRSNSQMYKQAGNSIVVNVLVEIFKNLLK